MSPADEVEVARLLAEARKKLAELEQVAAEAIAQARAAIASGDGLEREHTKALNRAAFLARYVADCAQRAGHDPKRRRQHATVPRWLGRAPDPAAEPGASREHPERRNVEASSEELRAQRQSWADGETSIESLGSKRKAGAPSK